MKTGMEYKREILNTIKERKEEREAAFVRKTGFVMEVMGYVTIAIGIGILIAGLIKG